jgi:hypothetical protein
VGRACSVYYFLQRMGLFLHIFYYPHPSWTVTVMTTPNSWEAFDSNPRNCLDERNYRLGLLRLRPE